jgi:hypothetical protein
VLQFKVVDQLTHASLRLGHLAAALKMETVQDGMDHRPEHDAGDDDEYQARKKRVSPGEPLASCCV